MNVSGHRETQIFQTSTIKCTFFLSWSKAAINFIEDLEDCEHHLKQITTQFFTLRNSIILLLNKSISKWLS